MDGAWSHRRNADHFWLPIVDGKDMTMITAVVLKKDRYRSNRLVSQGNHVGGSKLMEGHAVDQVLQWLSEEKLLPLVDVVVIDKDNTTTKQVRQHPELKHVRITYDPGHIRKNVAKSLDRVFVDPR